jgi:hypothetical protein
MHLQRRNWLTHFRSLRCYLLCLIPLCVVYSLLQNIREVKVLRRYHIQNREDYVKYNRLVGGIHQIVHKLKKLSPNDPYRIQSADQLMQKLSVTSTGLSDPFGASSAVARPRRSRRGMCCRCRCDVLFLFRPCQLVCVRALLPAYWMHMRDSRAVAHVTLRSPACVPFASRGVRFAAAEGMAFHALRTSEPALLHFLSLSITVPMNFFCC